MAITIDGITFHNYQKKLYPKRGVGNTDVYIISATHHTYEEDGDVIDAGPGEKVVSPIELGF